jgi:hypothetical protein
VSRDESVRNIVEPASARRTPLLVQWRLRKAKKRGGAGVLLHVKLGESARTLNSHRRYVMVKEGRSVLCAAGAVDPWSKWADLPPGRHRITFTAKGKEYESFSETFDLGEGDVLLVGCVAPHHNFRWSKKSLPPDRWYISVV